MPSLLQNDPPFEVRVSSVLNRDIKKFGKKYIFDGCDDTCWNSDEGFPQWVLLQLATPVTITGFKIQFQGGFVGQDCRLEINKEDSKDVITELFYPEDVNEVQTFTLSKPCEVKNLKFVFEKSTDFFGRIVIYYMDIISSS